jgi:hypothetical protein
LDTSNKNNIKPLIEQERTHEMALKMLRMTREELMKEGGGQMVKT